MYPKRNIWSALWVACAVLAFSGVCVAEAPSPLMVCEDPQCGSSIEEGACVACTLYRQTMMEVPANSIHFEGYPVEDGVALRATSWNPATRDLLWNVSVARNEILERAHQGVHVDLCRACRTNVATVEEIQFSLERIPEGVLLVYTSPRDDLVQLLQVMLMSGHELPL